MKLNTSELTPALKLLTKTLGNTKDSPLLNCVKLSTNDGICTVSTFDLVNTTTVTVLCDGSLDTPILIPHKDLSIVSNSGNTLEINVSDKISISSENVNFSIGISDMDEYPEFPTPDAPSVMFELDTETLRLMKTASKFAATDMSKHIIASVCLRNGHLYATNGNMLYKAQTKLTDTIECVIPISLVNAIAQFSEGVNISISDNLMTASGSVMTITGMLIGGSYPDCDRLIPNTCQTSVNVNSNALLASIKPINELFIEVAGELIVDVDESSITFEVGRDEKYLTTKCQMELVEIGDTTNLGINIKYLTTILSGINSQIELGLTGFNTPILIKYDAVTVLLMPLMIRK